MTLLEAITEVGAKCYLEWGYANEQMRQCAPDELAVWQELANKFQGQFGIITSIFQTAYSEAKAKKLTNDMRGAGANLLMKRIRGE